MNKYKAYIHGVALGSVAPGGWAALTLDPKGSEIKLHGRANRTTGNRMILRAALAVLNDLESPCDVEIVTCNKYFAANFAKKTPRGNWELWGALFKKCFFHHVTVTFDPRLTVDGFGATVRRVAEKEATRAAED